MRQLRLSLELIGRQVDVYESPARFRVLVAGRRFGKTQLALVELLTATWEPHSRVAWYVAPSYRQAKRIAWERLKSLLRAQAGLRINETELTMHFPSGSSVALKGADQYDSLRGNGLDFVVLDEFASMKPEVWPEVIRPALADRKGRALFIGTPQGHDHLYDRFQFAQADSGLTGASTPEGKTEFAGRAGVVAGPLNKEWAAFHFTTIQGGNVTAEELASAASELDERLYRQEFEASFESTALGLAYYAFSRTENVRPCRYRPGARLIWSLDFNVHPMCSVIAQRDGDNVEVLDGLVLDNANTPLACQRFWDRVHPWRAGTPGPLQIEVYGDASGHQRRTCGTATDWNLIRDFFAQHVGSAVVHIKAATTNPGVRDRVNLVNSKLLNAAGERRLFIDPKCKELIRDFERVCWRADDLGQPTTELDKSERMLTHVSDALGYYLAQAFPLWSKNGERRDRLF
jgi:hypothetical protein